ncbi:MAG: zinc ribbon domain-containing protein [Bacteroides sp.]|uniref:zinc ribbon domain-containing protein n=1 Tax=Bacteroides sp. TaxID=29523 RepID=UPI0025C17F4E|nr:zinc ribbon domain-containing protein [Bacteroides sp.]MBS6237361.1 zinc ribbon domain-containing protein [Bacteroides sp.]
MTAKEVFTKTLVFGWIKLGLGLLNILIAIVLFAILMGVSVLFASEGVGAIMFFIWLVAIGVVNFIINHYIGYLVKAGYVAIIATAFKTGTVPADPVNTGKAMVKERFGTSNVYFALDKLIAGSVKQLQRTLGRIADGLLGAIPGTDGVKSLMNMFLDISLGYIDECCLGYTFNHPEQNAYKSAADGVVIYAQNWKTLLKDATKTTLMVIISIIAVTLVAFIIFGGLFRLFGWSGFVAFVISLFLAWTVKYAFIDSWILVKMMSSYMQVVPNTQITFDLYRKLGGLSKKFKELFKKGQDGPNEVTKPNFCPSCGTSLSPDTAFCGNCGTRLGEV